jgi:hypothetical protein
MDTVPIRPVNQDTIWLYGNIVKYRQRLIGS